MTCASLVERLALALVRLAPESHQGTWCDHTRQTLGELLEDTQRSRGCASVLAVGLRELADIAWTLVLLRLGHDHALTHGHTARHRPFRQESLMLSDDLRHALRRLRAKPGTASLAIAMLALAIGVTSAMFTVTDHMLLRPVPFREAANLVWVWPGAAGCNPYLKPEVVRALRESGAFESVSGFVQGPAFVEGSQGPSTQGGGWVTPGTFEMLGVSPMLGRTFSAGEGQPGTDDRVILAESVWRRDFNRDPEIIGKRILLSGVPATVVGVMPAGFGFPGPRSKIWRPYDLDLPPAAVVNRPVTAYGRLKNGMPPSEATRVASAVVKVLPLTPPIAGVHFRGLATGMLDEYSTTAIRVLAAGVALVFLVLCANVTNLILARTMARRQEFGVCAALGASRGRLVREAFLESALMGLAALVFGLAIAAGLLALSRSALPEAFLLRTLSPVGLDVRALIATSLVGTGAIVAAGLLPAWIGTKTNVVDSLRVAGRGSSESRLSRVWTRVLLVGEVALASALLAGAGVLVTSFVRLTTVDSGLQLQGVTTMWIDLPAFYFRDRASRVTFANDLRTRLAGLPGVEAVSMSYGLPPGGSFSSGLVDADRAAGPGVKATVYFLNVEPDFFRVYGIALLQGRTFGPDDGPDSVVVSERLAQILWPGTSALGHSFKFRDFKEWSTVIGVAHEVRNPLSDPREDMPEYYARFSGAGGTQVFLGIRCTSACPEEPVIREHVRASSPHAMVNKISPLDAAYLEQFARPRAAAELAFGFAAVSILAAAGGLYSVLAYAVNRRQREFGIRAAMGARPRQLSALVFRHGVLIAVPGLFIGGALAWQLSEAVNALAFGVTLFQPSVWLVVASVVGATTLLAAWRPALEAMRADPVTLLRDS
jgi:putative ABC transport system permease protein